jgi:hypothetical protein
MANGYDKIEYRVNGSVPFWKEWPRRLRRVYASLEDWGSSEIAIQDMVEVWGWKWESINRLIKSTPTFEQALEAYRNNGNYPTRKGWQKAVTTSQLKTVYMREGELAAYAMLEADPKAINFHRDIVEKNGMLDMAEPFQERKDIETHAKWAEDTEQVENPVSDDSGLASFKVS